MKRLCKNSGLSITNNHTFRMSLNSNILIKAGLDAKTRAGDTGASYCYERELLHLYEKR